MKTLFNKVKNTVIAKKNVALQEISLIQLEHMQVCTLTSLLGQKQWFVEELWNKTQDVKEVRLDISHLYLLDGNKVTVSEDRVVKANTDYAILVSYIDGLPHVIDGRHRLAKLHSKGIDTVIAKVIDLPNADIEVCLGHITIHNKEAYKKYLNRFHTAIGSNLSNLVKKVLF